MDILYRASWKQSRRNAKTGPLPVVATEPSGIRRLVLAIIVIAATVGLLAQAERNIKDDRAIASTTVRSHLGGLK